MAEPADEADINDLATMLAVARHVVGDHNLADDVLEEVARVREGLHKAGLSWAELDALPGLGPVGTVAGTHPEPREKLSGPEVAYLASRIGAISAG